MMQVVLQDTKTCIEIAVEFCNCFVQRVNECLFSFRKAICTFYSPLGKKAYFDASGPVMLNMYTWKCHSI